MMSGGLDLDWQSWKAHCNRILIEMNWKKLGNIFHPEDYTFQGEPLFFAQSPQTLIFDDFVRVYFSTRRVDPLNGKYFSHVAFSDFTKDFKKIIRISKNPVITLGKLGTFDEHGIFPINPLRDGARILAYTCGWSRRTSVSVETSTGLAISHDGGETFGKIGDGPVLSTSLHEPFLVGDSFVIVESGAYRMWYIFGICWIDNTQEEPARVYKIGYAHSANGIDWIRQGKQIISDSIDVNECQALPTVLKHNGLYHMYFCYRHAIGFREDKSRGYRLGYAYSEDGNNWTRDDLRGGMEVSQNGWDSEMICYPHIFKCEEKVLLLYNGNEFGKFGFGLAELQE
jgi:hypothetical protein